ncbi:AraC family transcriptional regulator [Chitinophaga sp. Cy-1792]|uniref:AraC family transcriptional regulator n=1 Tax=Chitinophaga sp. Cy-1792 TaxID=2608339 RepID=UPI001422C378|nr:AraC family transcriptional regulator [Chitinophaga sp. Cy-1792]NIG53962.1 helix-turn-helix transcriptional regulator [Chitinophaga sp. Cy-1792]
MKMSPAGKFYGSTNEAIHLPGFTLTDTVYTQPRVPWHYHENRYFTFLLAGGMTEANKKKSYECVSGDLLFHNWDDAHYNIASDKYTRGIHIEVHESWFAAAGINSNVSAGSSRINDPVVKQWIYEIFREMKLSGIQSQLAIDVLLVQIFGRIGEIKTIAEKQKPQWLKNMEELLSAGSVELSLTVLAGIANVHPVHLSREFSRFYGVSLGEFVRAVRMQKAMKLLSASDVSLTDVAYDCGFSDQSHFIRSFKVFHQITPLQFRKLLHPTR